MNISTATWLREVSAALVVTGLFTITGAFATGRDFTLVPRFFYWLVIVSVAAVSFHLAVHWCLRGGLYALRERALRVAAGALFGACRRRRDTISSSSPPKITICVSSPARQHR
ncbi:MAG: hypothetical protein AAF764_11350 [Pseudomonadota bacterium]